MVSTVLQVAVCFGFLALTFGQRFERPVDCPDCDPNLCDEKAVAKCGAGPVKDRCGCCDVCAKTEYEMCDHPEAKNPKGLTFGTCGHHLECRLRDDLSDREAPEALCYCLDSTTICGSDGKTYKNKCAMKAAASRTGKNIKVNFKGPCQSPPEIVSAPENIKNKTGSNIFLVCEAKGYPIPSIQWTWIRVDSTTSFLPTDDTHVSVNTRGGPEKWEVTGWLQITGLQKEHEGDYQCIAQNDLGMVNATARVNVVVDKDHHKKHHKHKNHHNEI